MDISDIKLGMMVRTGLGKVGKVKEINRAGVVIELPNGEEYGAGFNCIEPEYTSGISIEDVRLGMELVTSGGIQGKVVAISKEGGLWLETADRTRFPVHVECVKPVDELGPGDTVHMVGKIEFLVVYGGTQCASVGWDDGNSSTIPVAHLVKCDDWKPLAEVAKCYKQVEPDQLFMSREARRVIEYLRARDCPVYIHIVFEGMKDVMSGAAIMDGLIEAREAGIVRLDDGKYSIVRD
jgi:preprotein translocase subunit YajC